MNEALAALDTIKEPDIVYIRKLMNPPLAIRLVLEAVCVVLDVKPVKVRVHVTLFHCRPVMISCETVPPNETPRA